MRYQQCVKYTHDYEVMCDFVISTLPINDSVTFCYLKGMTVPQTYKNAVKNRVYLTRCVQNQCQVCMLIWTFNYDIHVYQMKHSHAHGLDLCQYDSYLLRSIKHVHGSPTKLCFFGEISIQSHPYGTEQCLLLDCGRCH